MVVDGNAAKEFIEDNDETQDLDLEMPIYYVGLDIVKPHLISCTLGKYIPYYCHLLVILWPLGYNSITPPWGGGVVSEGWKFLPSFTMFTNVPTDTGEHQGFG